MIRRFFPAAVIACTIAAVVACGKSNPASPTSNGSTGTTVTGTGTGGTGRLTVKMKDAPFDEAKAVLVTISEVSVHASGGAWKTVSTVSRTCNLKQLVSAQDILGTATLDAVHYTQIRLTVTDAKLYFDNPFPLTSPCVDTTAFLGLTPPAGTFAAVNVPSGELKINREFDLAANTTTEMVLDFDGKNSIHQTGNGKYQMSPVISVVSVQ